jgi:hypothetical protein
LQHVSLQGQVLIFKCLRNISSLQYISDTKNSSSELLSIVTIFAIKRKPIMTSQVFLQGKPPRTQLKIINKKIRNFYDFPGTGGECKNRVKEMQARLPLADCCLGCQPIREDFTSSPVKIKTRRENLLEVAHTFLLSSYLTPPPPPPLIIHSQNYHVIPSLIYS